MPAIEFVISVIGEKSLEVGWNKLNHREKFVKILKDLKINPKPPPNDFEAIYILSLVEYGVDKLDLVKEFFRDEYIKKAFHQSFIDNNSTLLDHEADEIIKRFAENKKFNYIDYDPRLELDEFTRIFNLIVDNTRTLSQIKSDQQQEIILDKVKIISNDLKKMLTEVEKKQQDIRTFPSNRISPIYPSGFTPGQLPIPPNIYAAPEPDHRFTGRQLNMDVINKFMQDSTARVLSVIGFGGMGKSWLVRAWLDSYLMTESPHGWPWLPFDGILWINCYEINSINRFLDDIFEYLRMGGLNVYVKNKSTASRIRHLGELVREGRFLFIFDGIETMQYDSGNEIRYGELISHDLRDFLYLLTDSMTHDSRCLITSRIPLNDINTKTGYVTMNIDKLTLDEGVELLTKYGIIGDDSDRRKIVSDNQGYPLALSLIASYLVKYENGDPLRISQIPQPLADETMYQKIHRILKYYDKRLDSEERAFLQVFSVFRPPVNYNALINAFRKTGTPQTDILARLPIHSFQDLIDGLLEKRLISIRSPHRTSTRLTGKSTNLVDNDYEIHPLIREFYLQLKPEEYRSINLHLANYARSLPVIETPTQLKDLTPFIDEFFYLCAADLFDEAYYVYKNSIDPKDRNVGNNEEWDIDNIGLLSYHLGAAETDLDLLRNFFVDKDFLQDMKLTDTRAKAYVGVSAGLDLDLLGQPFLAASLYKRSGDMANLIEDWTLAAWSYQNTAEIGAQLGNLAGGLDAAENAIIIAGRTSKPVEELSAAYIRKGWIQFLMGKVNEASEYFEKAGAVQPADDPDPIPWNWSYYEGVWYSSYLVRTGNLERANIVARANLAVCEDEDMINDALGCRRILADIAYYREKNGDALKRYNTVFKKAKDIGMKLEMALSLLGIGRTLLRLGRFSDARVKLLQALDICQSSGFRLYEAEILNSLATLYIVERSDQHKTINIGNAYRNAEAALQIGIETGYKWAESEAHYILGIAAKIDNKKETALRHLVEALGIQKDLQDIRITETEVALMGLN